MIQEEGKYYLYRHVRLDTNEVFYVGIGLKYPNKYTHKGVYKRAHSKLSRTDFWKSIITKTEYVVDILLETDDVEFLNVKEKEFIALYGRRDLDDGTLCNLTDGGEGVQRRISSEKTKEKMRLKRLGTKLSEETKKRMRESNICNTEAYRQKMSQVMSGRKLSDSHKESLRRYRSGLPKKVKVRKRLDSTVLQYDLEGNFIKEYSSIREACNISGYKYNNINNACNCHFNNKAYGFIWKYKRNIL